MKIDPIQRSPHGLSDHCSVEVQPRDRNQLPNQRRTIRTRDLRPNNRDAMRVYLQQVGIDPHIDALDTCARKASALESIVQVGMDFIIPLQSKTTVVNHLRLMQL